MPASTRSSRPSARIDMLVSAMPASRSSAPIEEFAFAKWKKLLAIHLDGAFLTTRAALRTCTSRARAAASSTWARCIRKEASPLKAPYVTAKHGA